MPRKTPQVMARITALKAMREKQSEALGMEPGFLINNATLTALAIENPATRADQDATGLLRNWQKEALGDTILKTLNAVK
jgi:ribonuclease D